MRTRGIKEIKYSDIEGGEPSEELKVPSFISQGIVDVCTYVNENKNR